MRIRLVTPAPPRSPAPGNRRHRRRAGAAIPAGASATGSTCPVDYAGEPADLMGRAARLAAARRQSPSFAARHPGRPLIVALTGTDRVNRFIHSHPEADASARLCSADRLVGLHDLIAETVPSEHRAKVRVIYQSARAGRPGGATRQGGVPASASPATCARRRIRCDQAYAVRKPASRRAAFALSTTAAPTPRVGPPRPRPRWPSNPALPAGTARLPTARLRRVYASAHLLALPFAHGRAART